MSRSRRVWRAANSSSQQWEHTGLAVRFRRHGGKSLSSFAMKRTNSERASLELEGPGEDADRLRALRSLRRKRTKPEDWMSGTFHQYDISDVVGAGTFGQVWWRARELDWTYFLYLRVDLEVKLTA